MYSDKYPTKTESMTKKSAFDSVYSTQSQIRTNIELIWFIHGNIPNPK